MKALPVALGMVAAALQEQSHIVLPYQCLYSNLSILLFHFGSIPCSTEPSYGFIYCMHMFRMSDGEQQPRQINNATFTLRRIVLVLSM